LEILGENDRSVSPKAHSDKKVENQALTIIVINPENECTSFFAKLSFRPVAFHRHSRGGWNFTIWGHPVPDVTQTDFNHFWNVVLSRVASGDELWERAVTKPPGRGWSQKKLMCMVA
jgi:hypothetical protein